MLNPWAYDSGVGRVGRTDKQAVDRIRLATEDGDLSFAFRDTELGGRVIERSVRGPGVRRRSGRSRVR